MMRNYYLIVLLIIILIPSQAYSQRDKGAEIAAGVVAAGAVAAAVAVAVSVEDMKEELEYHANNYVVSNLGDTHYKLKLLDFNGKNRTDEGDQKLVTFSYKTYNENLSIKERKIIFMHGSPGWLAPTGLRVESVTFSVWDIERWDGMAVTIAEKAALIDLDFARDRFRLEGSQTPLFTKVGEKYCEANDEAFLGIQGIKPGTVVCYKFSRATRLSLTELKFDSRGICARKNSAAYMPFRRFSGDFYILADFDEEFKVFLNEGTIGLYEIQSGRSILIREKLLKKIAEFFTDS